MDLPVCLSSCLIIPSLPRTRVYDQSLHSSPKGHFLMAPLPKPRGADTATSEWRGSHLPVPRMPVRAGHVTGKPERGALPAAPCPCGFGLFPTFPRGRRRQEDGKGERTRLPVSLRRRAPSLTHRSHRGQLRAGSAQEPGTGVSTTLDSFPDHFTHFLSATCTAPLFSRADIMPIYQMRKLILKSDLPGSQSKN